MPLFEEEILESLFRLLIAALAGMAIGLNRDIHNKPVGMRTLGLVSLGSALVVLSCTGYGSLHYQQDAVVDAWRSLPGLRDPERFDAWLTRLLVRSCQDLRRRPRRRCPRPLRRARAAAAL